jgi:YD repeat-containing protein
LNWGTQRPADALIYNVCPAFDAAQNNGNLLGKAEYVGGPAAAAALTGFGQSFSYDGVNRLTGVSDSGYTRSFGYDQWGNMWVSGYSVLAPAGNAPTANIYSNNRMNGTSYDAAGNQSVVNGNSVAYDAENRQVSVTEPPGLGGSTESYLYDGSGQRVQKSGPGGTTTYVYDAFGGILVSDQHATLYHLLPEL